jgi:hypothetical protein
MMTETTTKDSLINDKMKVAPLTVKKSPSWTYCVFISIFSVVVLGFLLCRVVELIDSCFMNPLNFMIMVISYIATFSLFIRPPKTSRLTVRRIGLAVFVSAVLLMLYCPPYHIVILFICRLFYI